MQSLGIIQNIKKHRKDIALVTLLLISMPLIEILIKIIFTYGTYVGTFIRNISESGVCF